MRHGIRHAMLAKAVTDDRDGALGVDVLLRGEDGQALLVRSAGTSTDEAIERAVEVAEQSLGGSWGCDDWFAAS